MTDPRVEKMADVIARYSLGLKEGELALLQGDEAGFPLLREVYRHALRAGAHPVVRTSHSELAEILYSEGSDGQIGHVSELALLEVEKIDARLVVRASENLKALSGVPAEKLGLSRRAGRKYFDRYMERRAKGELRACLTQYPTNASAQLAGMSLSGYREFVFGACLLNGDDPVAAWQSVSREQQRYVDFLDKVAELRFEAPDTDITLSVKGRKWINSDGKANFPSGEVFSAPVEDSVNGHIRYDVPVVYLGRSVEGIELEFKDGKVVSARADRGEELLKAQLDVDEGSRTLGEVAFGLNYGITRPTGNILFDEKIGGTIHLAVGAGYPDSGSKNKSAIHWDMIRSMKPGRALADGKVIYEDGRFTL